MDDGPIRGSEEPAVGEEAAPGPEPAETAPDLGAPAYLPLPGPRDVVVVGGSGGAFEALRELLDALPGDLPAAVFVVVHVPSGHESLARACSSATARCRCAPRATARRSSRPR